MAVIDRFPLLTGDDWPVCLLITVKTTHYAGMLIR